MSSFSRFRAKVASISSSQLDHIHSELNPEIPLELHQSVLRHYTHQITSWSKHFGSPLSVPASATMLLHHVYLYKSVATLPALFVAPACLYIASKVQEVPLTPDQIIEHIPGVEASHLIRFEALVLEAVDFHIHFELPLQPIRGLLTLLFSSSLQLSTEQQLSLRSHSARIFEDLLMIKDILTYSPSQLAVAVILQACHEQHCDTVSLDNILQCMPVMPDEKKVEQLRIVVSSIRFNLAHVPQAMGHEVFTRLEKEVTRVSDPRWDPRNIEFSIAEKELEKGELDQEFQHMVRAREKESAFLNSLLEHPPTEYL